MVTAVQSDWVGTSHSLVVAAILFFVLLTECEALFLDIRPTVHRAASDTFNFISTFYSEWLNAETIFNIQLKLQFIIYNKIV